MLGAAQDARCQLSARDIDSASYFGDLPILLESVTQKTISSTDGKLISFSGFQRAVFAICIPKAFRAPDDPTDFSPSPQPLSLKGEGGERPDQAGLTRGASRSWLSVF
jgi:hypothetical protein